MFQSEPIRDYLVWNSRCIIFENNIESDDFLQISIMCQILSLNSLEMGILVKEVLEHNQEGVHPIFPLKPLSCSIYSTRILKAQLYWLLL